VSALYRPCIGHRTGYSLHENARISGLASADFEGVFAHSYKRCRPRLFSYARCERSMALATGNSVYVYPQWGNRRFLDIRRAAVNALLDRIVDHHGRSQADAVLAIVRGICNWYAARSEHYVSPIVAKMKRDKRNAKARARNRFLSDDEIRRVWKAAENNGSFGALVRFALLTGQPRERAAPRTWRGLAVWAVA